MRIRSDAVTVYGSGLAEPLGNREGQDHEDRSQETCLGVESRIRCTRVDLPASLYSLPEIGETAFGTERESDCGNAAAFIFFQNNFEKR